MDKIISGHKKYQIKIKKISTYFYAVECHKFDAFRSMIYVSLRFILFSYSFIYFLFTYSFIYLFIYELINKLIN